MWQNLNKEPLKSSARNLKHLKCNFNIQCVKIFPLIAYFLTDYPTKVLRYVTKLCTLWFLCQTMLVVCFAESVSEYEWL